jgi:hypothetical protein
MQEIPLSWSVGIAQIAHAPVDISYEATPKERDALKRYAGIEDLTSFTANVRILPLSHGRFRASGTLKASAMQASVVNLEAVPAEVGESFSVEYWPAESIGEADRDAPFDANAPEAIVGGDIPIGVLLCELFALALDPYPRNPGDEFEWTETEPGAAVSPFAELAKLKARKTPEEK